MSDPVPPASPVEPSSPIVGAKPALGPGKIAMMCGVAVATLLVLPPAFRYGMSMMHSEQKAAAPASTGIGQSYNPPPLPDQGSAPEMHQVAVTNRAPMMPLQSQQQAPGQPQQADPRLIARMSDIGGGGGSGGGQPREAGAGAGGIPHPILPQEAQPASPLAQALHPTTFASSHAVEISNPRFTIEQGRVLACTQQTKINTSFPGGVTAILPNGVRGETGDVTLLDPGSRVFGTIEHGMVNGLDRAFVLWQNITTPVMYDPDGTPRQLRVTVDSPAADELGQGGLDGNVNRHIWRKLGGVLGLSLIQGGIQAGTALAAGGGGGGGGSGNNSFTSLNFQQGDQLASQMLASTIQIPDVMTRDQGLPCSIFVMRDLVIDQYKLSTR